jgi:hypothetical protein
LGHAGIIWRLNGGAFLTILFINNLKLQNAMNFKSLCLLYFAICATFCHAQVTQAWLLKETGLLPTYHILTQEKGQYFLKNYQQFKGEYAFIDGKQDTLLLEANGMFKGSKYPIFSENGNMYLSISGKKTRKSLAFLPLNPCDTQINYIQNRSYTFHITHRMQDSANSYLGPFNSDYQGTANSIDSDSTRVLDSRRTRTFYDLVKTECPEIFKQQMDKSFQSILVRIKNVYAGKILRMKHLQDKSEKVDENYVLQFIDKIDYCEMDKRAFFHLVINYTDIFVKASDKLKKDSWELKHITEKMPSDLDLPLLKQKLLLTKIKWFSEKTNKDDVY